MKKRSSSRRKTNRRLGNGEKSGKRESLYEITKREDLLFRNERTFRLDDIQDYRRYEPDRRRIPLTTGAIPAKIRAKTSDYNRVNKTGKIKTYNDYRFEFVEPKKTITCVRRERRRQVLFAKNLAGKGSRSRQHRWTDESRISCKSRR